MIGTNIIKLFLNNKYDIVKITHSCGCTKFYKVKASFTEGSRDSWAKRVCNDCQDSINETNSMLYDDYCGDS